MGGYPIKAVPVSGALCFADRGRVCALGWARKGADVRVEWNILLLTIAGGESGTVVPLLTHVLSAPWCPSHASHSVIPVTVGGCSPPLMQDMCCNTTRERGGGGAPFHNSAPQGGREYASLIVVGHSVQRMLVLHVLCSLQRKAPMTCH